MSFVEPPRVNPLAEKRLLHHEHEPTDVEKRKPRTVLTDFVHFALVAAAGGMPTMMLLLTEQGAVYAVKLSDATGLPAEPPRDVEGLPEAPARKLRDLCVHQVFLDTPDIAAAALAVAHHKLDTHTGYSMLFVFYADGVVRGKFVQEADLLSRDRKTAGFAFGLHLGPRVVPSTLSFGQSGGSPLSPIIPRAAESPQHHPRRSSSPAGEEDWRVRKSALAAAAAADDDSNGALVAADATTSAGTSCGRHRIHVTSCDNVFLVRYNTHAFLLAMPEWSETEGRWAFRRSDNVAGNRLVPAQRDFPDPIVLRLPFATSNYSLAVGREDLLLFPQRRCHSQLPVIVESITALVMASIHAQLISPALTVRSSENAAAKFANMYSMLSLTQRAVLEVFEKEAAETADAPARLLAAVADVEKFVSTAEMRLDSQQAALRRRFCALRERHVELTARLDALQDRVVTAQLHRNGVESLVALNATLGEIQLSLDRVENMAARGN
jgi:hypothetical protein